MVLVRMHISPPNAWAPYFFLDDDVFRYTHGWSKVTRGRSSTAHDAATSVEPLFWCLYLTAWMIVFLLNFERYPCLHTKTLNMYIGWANKKSRQHIISVHCLAHYWRGETNIRNTEPSFLLPAVRHCSVHAKPCLWSRAAVADEKNAVTHRLLRLWLKGRKSLQQSSWCSTFQVFNFPSCGKHCERSWLR